MTCPGTVRDRTGNTAKAKSEVPLLPFHTGAECNFWMDSHAAVWTGQQEVTTHTRAGLRKGLPSHLGLGSISQDVISRHRLRNDSLSLPSLELVTNEHCLFVHLEKCCTSTKHYF